MYMYYSCHAFTMFWNGGIPSIYFKTSKGKSSSIPAGSILPAMLIILSLLSVLPHSHSETLWLPFFSSSTKEQLQFKRDHYSWAVPVLNSNYYSKWLLYCSAGWFSWLLLESIYHPRRECCHKTTLCTTLLVPCKTHDKDDKTILLKCQLKSC